MYRVIQSSTTYDLSFDVEIVFEPDDVIESSTIKPIRVETNHIISKFKIDQTALDEFKEFTSDIEAEFDENGFNCVKFEISPNGPTSRYYVFANAEEDETNSKLSTVIEVRISDHIMYPEHQFNEDDTREDIERKKRLQEEDEKRLKEHYKNTAEGLGTTKYKVKYITVNGNLFKSYEAAFKYFETQIKSLGNRYGDK